MQIVTLNENFQTNYLKLNLPIPALEEVYKKERVQEDRSHAIDSACIRIMKTRKRLEWSQLVQEVFSAMTLVKPQPAQIKKRIERLIEAEIPKEQPAEEFGPGPEWKVPKNRNRGKRKFKGRNNRNNRNNRNRGKRSPKKN